MPLNKETILTNVSDIFYLVDYKTQLSNEILQLSEGETTIH